MLSHIKCFPILKFDASLLGSNVDAESYEGDVCGDTLANTRCYAQVWSPHIIYREYSIYGTEYSIYVQQAVFGVPDFNVCI